MPTNHHLPKGWKETTLGEVAHIKNGKSRPNDGNLYPVYGGNGVLGNADEYNIDKEIIILGRVGAYCGSVFFEKNKFWLSDNALGVLANSNSNIKYLYYLLKQLNLNKQAIGGAQPLLTQGLINQIEIVIPTSLFEQRAIAAVLSSLDDKIELLREQNKTLEAIAQALFKEWFVNFNFPNAAGKPYKKSGGKMVDSELGEIPEGWRVGRLGELANIDPKEKTIKEDKCLFYDMKCLSINSMEIMPGEYKPVNSGSIFMVGDTLLAKITPCLENGKTGFVFDTCKKKYARGSTEFIVLRARNNANPYYIYCLARYSEFRDFAIKSMTGTSGRQRVQVGQLLNYPLVYDDDSLKRFEQAIASSFCKIQQNIYQIKILSSIRDALLPKLMRGEVRVRY